MYEEAAEVDPGPRHPRIRIASIVIPAHNEEEPVSGARSAALTMQAADGEFEIAVVCNGCTDASAQVARAAAPRRGSSRSPRRTSRWPLMLATVWSGRCPRLYLDADIELSTDAARALVASLESTEAVCGDEPGMGTSSFWQSTTITRRYYRAQLRARFPKHLVGQGVVALTWDGRPRCRGIPTTDRRRPVPPIAVVPDEWVIVDSHAVTVRAPRTVKDLLYSQARNSGRQHRISASLRSESLPFRHQVRRSGKSIAFGLARAWRLRVADRNRALQRATTTSVPQRLRLEDDPVKVRSCRAVD